MGKLPMLKSLEAQVHKIKLAKVKGINPSNCNQRVACDCGWKSIAATTEVGAAETHQFHIANPSIITVPIDDRENQHCVYCDRHIQSWGWTSEYEDDLFTCAWRACRDKLAAEIVKRHPDAHEDSPE